MTDEMSDEYDFGKEKSNVRFLHIAHMKVIGLLIHGNVVLGVTISTVTVHIPRLEHIVAGRAGVE